MSETSGRKYHSLKTIQQLKQAALPTHVENFEPPDAISRRTLLKLLMGASAALATGIPGCARKPERKIISRVKGPEYQKPGQPLYYASTWTAGSYPYGLLVKTVDGRPIKLEGNPDHPVNRGTSHAPMQAEILSLYDPDRLRAPRLRGREVTWEQADAEVHAGLRAGGPVILLTRASLGPAERALLARFLQLVPHARHFVHETAHDGPRRMAWRQVYGVEGELRPRYERARVILSVDCDFLAADEPVLENVRRFVAGRRLDEKNHAQATMSRLYVAEGGFTLTGSNADHRLRLRPSGLLPLVQALRSALRGEPAPLDSLAQRYGLDTTLLKALADDLGSHRGQALVVAGGHLPPAVHAAVALLNDELAAPGQTLEWNPTPPNLPVSEPAEVEAALSEGGAALICLGVNPVYDWPGGGFETLLKQARCSVVHSLHLDETAAAATLALPSHHNLEAWNDAEPRPGVESLCQPVIAPLFNTRQEAESLLRWAQALAPEGDPLHQVDDWHAWLQARWFRRLAPGPDSDPELQRVRTRAWEECLRVGGLFTEATTEFPSLNCPEAERLASADVQAGAVELVIQPHHGIHDGRQANNGWLQELPEPVSKLVWDNAVAMSPETAAGIGAREGEQVSLAVGGKTVLLPTLIVPGMAAGVVCTTLGHGRTAGGAIAQEAGGTNVAPLLGREAPAHPRTAFSVRLERAGGHRKIVRTQKEFSQHGRNIVLDGELEEFRRAADFIQSRRPHVPEADLYEPYEYKGHKWGMAIDLGACTGCGACMTACQAENNIPIVGREQCDLGREMHWIRIDRYHDGPPDDPRVQHQPMLCQHCDHAPCENVCPVNATTHSPEGLNEMVYNRCVGTRYCANNCPYKVRRFNFLRYQEAQLRDPVQELMFNPQVTVRGVGVMEKCTFCVQRITAARFAADDAGRALADGDIQTACQQACPAQAIVFGDLNDPNSRVSQLRAKGLAFHVLEELNVKPNVTYLARVRNPHPAVRRPDDYKHGSHEG